MLKFAPLIPITLAIAPPVFATEAADHDALNGVVIPMFDAVLAEDIERVEPLLAEDARILAMFNPTGRTGEGSPRQFPLLTYFKIVTENYDNIAFVNRTYSIADDGRTVWMEADGDLRVAATGEPYRNAYVFKVSIDDNGKVAEIKEWVNTVTLNQQGIPAGSD
ncbi:nuclear transport factor 2 family protein [Erythrobacter rubeus]|uniref:SnoaL-like domain-containing protein n=1 Tax=Erythrobacter rubeus TaxID=2760803 RepID=A0ABR8KKX9_9SPHN|nr:nuclear transport factor 2 family protein [Erythrobacter rubeus]MBD2840940.1 hypothetical protein [Erythrobacter rubeus]